MPPIDSILVRHYLPRHSLSFFPIPDEFIMRTSCVNICRTENPEPPSFFFAVVSVPSISPTTRRGLKSGGGFAGQKPSLRRHLSMADHVDLTVAPFFRTSFSLSGTVGLCVEMG